ncbi:uncharacterized protein I303_105706 [Kwoniella dejecticola CBS 10117]|uniref:Uncharacterized protein n=1 Tax=Kwoniella dejecticola CBS 10117 TaxID=1296121 RepID=A0A1A6A061_9TREE|nr:uncharacterized protein I303_05727 [Kwoniella dejecticola CBS 10117]OBR83448.1 hypothetical protein I303_05727 [Kwoniella dejecticola CBS 10117]
MQSCRPPHQFSCRTRPQRIIPEELRPHSVSRPPGDLSSSSLYQSTSSSGGQNEWTLIPLTRPRYSNEDKIGLGNLLSPKPSLQKMRSSHSHNSSDPAMHRGDSNNSNNGRGNLGSLRRTGSKIWTRAKQVGRTSRASIRRKTSSLSISEHRSPVQRHSTSASAGGVGAGNLDGISTDEEDDDWQIVTPPPPSGGESDEFTTSSTRSEISHPPWRTRAVEEEEMLEGARGTGTISRVSRRAQQGSTLDLLDLDTVEGTSSSASSTSRRIGRDHPAGCSNPGSESGSGSESTPSHNSGSGSGSGTGERSLEVILNKYHFPSPPSHSHSHSHLHSQSYPHSRSRSHSTRNDNSYPQEQCRHNQHPPSTSRPGIVPKRSWLEGGPLTFPEDREEVERKLPDDHPFNSPALACPSSSSGSTSTDSHTSCTSSHIPRHSMQSTPGPDYREEMSDSESGPDERQINKYHHWKNLLSSLEILKQALYRNNIESIKILSSSEDILPPAIISGIEKRLDRYWAKWTNVLNSAGQRISHNLNQLPGSTSTSTHQSVSQARPTAPPKEYLEGLIPPPLTQDEMIRLIWALEEKGQVASGTYRRMFGKNYNHGNVRKMRPDEEIRADQMGMRDWMVGQQEMEERSGWRGGRR